MCKQLADEMHTTLTFLSSHNFIEITSTVDR